MKILKHTLTGAGFLFLAACFGDGSPTDAELKVAMDKWLVGFAADRRSRTVGGSTFDPKFTGIQKKTCVKKQETLFDCLVSASVVNGEKVSGPNDFPVQIEKQSIGWVVKDVNIFYQKQ